MTKDLQKLVGSLPEAYRKPAVARIEFAIKLGFCRIQLWNLGFGGLTDYDLVGYNPKGEFDFLPSPTCEEDGMDGSGSPSGE